MNRRIGPEAPLLCLAALALTWACGSGNGGSTGGSGGATTGGSGGAATGGSSGTGGSPADAGTDGPKAADASSDERPPTDTAPADAPPSSGGLCGDRTGGALVRFTVCDTESLTVWITDGAFIDQSIANKGKKGPIPVFRLVDGKDCDAAYTWHVDPAVVSYADTTIEVCDGCPHLVEQGKTAWLTQTKTYCPWAAQVADVVDRRK